MKRGFAHIILISIFAATLFVFGLVYLKSLQKTPYTKPNPAQSPTTAATQSATKNTDNTSSWKTFISKKLNLSINYPEGWKAQELYGAPNNVLVYGETDYVILNKPKQNRQIVIVEDGTLGAPTNDIRQEKIVISNKTVTLHEYQGFLTADEGKPLSTNSAGLVVFDKFVQDKNNYIISGTWIQNDTKAADEITKIISTIKFLN